MLDTTVPLETYDADTKVRSLAGSLVVCVCSFQQTPRHTLALQTPNVSLCMRLSLSLSLSLCARV